jgi:RNA polymerase sigma-70 factor (ECF subfamily)
MAADLDDIFRQEAGRLVPYLLRRLGPRHFDLAEDAVQDAFVAALRHWPASGVPDDPRAWLLRAAHRKALDRLKRDHTAERKAHLLQSEAPAAEWVSAPGVPDEIAVLLLACHPALPRDSQVALALRTLGGLSTPEVARALLISEKAAAQRIVRAKREIARLGAVAVSGDDLESRIDAVMDVLYLIYNEGHHATFGADLVRRHLVGDAIHLAELLVSVSATKRPRGHALLALMYFGASRLAARTDELGDLVVLEDQDRDRWDAAHLTRAFHHLDFSARGSGVSRFHLEAGIAAIHAGAVDLRATDWAGILSLYDELLARFPSPIVALNRAVAVLHVHGPEAAEAALAPARADPSLALYAPLHAVAAELASRRGDAARATALLDRALACPGSEPQKRFLERRRRLVRPTISKS